MGDKGRNVLVRGASGLVLLVVVLGAVLLSEYTFALLLAVIGVGCMLEFYTLAFRKESVRPQRWYAVAVGVIAVGLSFLVANGTVRLSYMALLIPLVAMIFAIELFRKSVSPILNVSVSIAGLVYAALPMALVCFIGFMGGSYNPYVILSYIFIVWVNDIFAFLTGILVGKHRMLERISPKKSWEGFVGGLVFAIAFSTLCGHLLGQDLVFWGGLGAVVVIAGVLGDFIESMLKREAGVKDSGNILPGHGGFMDRFDALLYSAPFVFVYFTIFT